MVDKYEKYKHNIVLCFDLAATHFEEELQEDIDDCCAEILKCIDKLKEYEKIGTIDEFKALKEKSAAKKMDRYYCPICRHYFEDGELHNYCPECGQALEN